MLTRLRIQNFAIVDHLEVAFHSGLQVVTGETGAGKSILVDALEVVLGARSQPELVRTGAEEAVVEALFEGDGVDARLGSLGLPTSDGELLVRRVISRSGRGKVTINGALSTVGMLARVCSGLVDLSGQHEHVALLDASRHLDLLDGFAGLRMDRTQYQELHGRFLEASRTRVAAASNDADRARRVDYLGFQLREIEELEPKPGEEEHLTSERQRLASAERLRALGETSLEALTSESGATTVLARAVARLSEAEALDAAVGPLLHGAKAALVEAEEAARSLRRYVASVEDHPERLVEMDERLDVLRKLARKHGVGVDELAARAEAMRFELEGLQNHERRLEDLQRVEGSARDAAVAAGRALFKRRQEAASHFAKAVRKELSSLALSGTRLEMHVTCTPDALGASGLDEAELMISTNPGEPLRPLVRVASGGELSRVLLAIKRALAQAYPVDTYVLDEADAGVGGAVAEAVGRMLREVAEHRQVFCITHLPQVAAFASHHFVVTKQVVSGRTLSGIRELHGSAERKHELARMVAGAQISPAALEHAGHLLQIGEAKPATSRAVRSAHPRARTRASA